MNEPEPDTLERAAPGAQDERDTRGHAERLGQQVAELYNENTLLRERVRRLENEVRRAQKRA